MDTWTILLSVIAVVTALYYLFRKESFFDKYGIIHTRGMPLLGHMGPLIFRRCLMTEMVTELYNLHSEAKYVGMYDCMTPVVVIRDPELIKTLAVKKFDHFVNRQMFIDPEQEPLFGKNLSGLRGEEWRKMRALLSPAFSSGKMKAMFKLMSKCGKNFANFLANETEGKPGTYNSKEIFARYGTDVIATCAFGVEVDSMRNRDNDFFVLGQKTNIFKGFTMFKFMLMRSVPAVTKVLGVRLFDQKLQNFFTELVRSTVEMRDKEGIVRPDMIQLMMETRNNEEGEGPALTIAEMTSQAFLFFFGGFETTSSVLCFIAHHIAADPELQRKLQEEIDEIYQRYNEELTYEGINSTQYIDAVLNEVLRMYPIGVMLDRVCTKEFELPPALPGQQPVPLKKGANICFPIYALHMDPNYFPDPQKFYPERFIEDPKNTAHSPVFFPFGVGPRICLGNRFAILEIKALVFHLLLRCTLKISEKMIMPMRLSKSTLNMTAEGGFWLTIEPRNKGKSVEER